MAQIKLNATYGMTGTLPAVSGANLTTLNGSNISSGTVADARISALTASKLTGALPAISGASLTTLNATNISSGTLNAARYSGGKIGQVVWDDCNTYFETTSTTLQDVADFTVNITPSATSSYLWCMATFNCQQYGNAASLVPGGEVYITDGSDTILATTEMRVNHSSNTYDSSFAGALNAYYTPNTTSQVTIKIRSHADAGRWAIYRTVDKKNSGTLTVMEILA